MRVFFHSFEPCMSSHWWRRWYSFTIPLVFKCSKWYQLSFTLVLSFTYPWQLALSLSFNCIVHVWLLKLLRVIHYLLIVLSWYPFIRHHLLLAFMYALLYPNESPLFFPAWYCFLLYSQVLLQRFRLSSLSLSVGGLIWRGRPHVDQSLPGLRVGGFGHIFLGKGEVKDFGCWGSHHDLLLSFGWLLYLLSLFVWYNFLVHLP